MKRDLPPPGSLKQHHMIRRLVRGLKSCGRQRHTAALCRVHAAAEEPCILRQTHRHTNGPQFIRSGSAAHNKPASHPPASNAAEFSVRRDSEMHASHKSRSLLPGLLLFGFSCPSVPLDSPRIWLRDETEQTERVEAAERQRTGRKGTL